MTRKRSRAAIVIVFTMPKQDRDEHGGADHAEEGRQVAEHVHEVRLEGRLGLRARALRAAGVVAVDGVR